MESSEHLAWAREFVGRREIARRSAWERQAVRAGGVCWSGLAPPPYRPRSSAELEREAYAWAERRSRSLAAASIAGEA